MQQIMTAEVEKLHKDYKEMTTVESQRTSNYREKYLVQMNLAETQKFML